MYTRILVAIEHSAADATIVEHVCQLARMTHAELILVHVADGWAARHFDELALRESEEMRDDREYLEALAARLLSEGLPTQWRLGRGDPAAEIVRISRAEGVDLIAMATHGHRGINDLIRGTTVNKVRHDVSVPVLLLRAKSSPSPQLG